MVESRVVKEMVFKRLVLLMVLLTMFGFMYQCAYAVEQGPIGVLFLGRVGGWG